MKKLLLFLSLLACCLIMNAKTNVTMDDVWKEFRANHPYGFQTVGLKHNGDEQIFVISEPSESVSYQTLQSLFGSYDGTVTIKKDSLGYDGWLADVVGCIKFKNSDQETEFKNKLFTLLYGTNYKAYYTDLDRPSRHSYFAPYKYNLNFSITAAELKQWFVDEKETFSEFSKQGVTGKPIASLLSSGEKNPNKLFYSRERGFVVWLINPSGVSDNESFRLNARKFALDTDLIIGALGAKGKTVAIVARERQIPIDILPPMRIETLSLLATTKNESLAQSYERHNIFASKLPDNSDVAPIYLSDELWHTEYGNLLNVTDQMLKSWSENGDIDYKKFGHPKPIDWAFEKGAVRDLDANQLTYNWNTAGAGYVIEGENFDIYAVNRTGSLPVSYIPGGMEGRVDQKVYEAEEMAYDFFSGLNSPELARVVQYATFYQIFSYFKGDNDTPAANVRPNHSFENNVVPNYRVFDSYVERILQMVQNSSLSRESDEYKSALSRFAKRFRDNNAHTRLRQLIENDPYGEFADYLQQTEQKEHFDSLLNFSPTDAEIEESFWAYLNPNLDTIRAYISSYEKSYGSFPIKDASHFIVSPREIEEKINEINAKKPGGIIEYEKRVSAYNYRLDSLRNVAKDLESRINAYNEKVKAGTATNSEYRNLGLEQSFLSIQFDNLEKERKAIDKLESGILSQIENNNKEVERLVALMVNDSQQKALGALNWLLTDPSPYSEPSGLFFASKLTTHRQWMKSPSMACSTSGFGYGGHNLDAHVTPIKTVLGLGKNKCRISFKNGKPIVSVAKENIARVTRSFLRKVERQINTDKIIDLPEPPKNRDKSFIVASNSLKKERGLDLASQNEVEQGSRFLSIKGKEIRDENELIAALNQFDGNENVTIQPYSEREILVQQGNKEFIVERSDNYEYGDYPYSQEVSSHVEGEYLVVELQNKSSLINGNVQQATILTFPKSLSDYSAKIERSIRDFSGKLENWFKLKQHIKKSIDEELYQDFDMGVKRSLFAPVDALQEFNPYSIFIIKKDENDVLFFLAA